MSDKSAIDFSKLDSRQLDAIVSEKIVGVTTPDPAPYSTDLNAAWEMEEKMGQDRLWFMYQEALWKLTAPNYPPEESQGACIIMTFHPTIHATARQKCIAALSAYDELSLGGLGGDLM